MSISEAGRKVGLSKSTAIRKVKQWNQMTSEIVEKGFPGSIATKVGKGRPAILKDQHTVFIFELLANEPTLTVEAVTDNLSKEFRDILITLRSVENHMKKNCRLTYKRIIPRYYGRNTDETIAKRRDAVAYWVSQNIDFMNECVFLDEAGFNRSMHRSYGWSEAGAPCKIDVQTKGANVSILGAICKSGLITLSRKEVILGARSGKRTRTGEKSQALKKKGTTSSDFLEYIEQVLTTLDTANMSYKYLVLDNASIHKAALIEGWIGQRGYKLLFLSPYSPFLNPIEEFWSKLNTVVNNDPSSVRQNEKISDRIRNASFYISRKDCENWIKHSLTFWQRCLNCEKGL
ncbi:hypothetical protein G6F70_006404 [Rhizopus microsporus]|nr:hypothetical protein G6F71_006308 [Rhizopus microsporus]KAG1197707.1 hypothetical protein G6F70_006404 [Rhizopus microsporus]KAG1209509.1 hypothetical protein G6F69_006287 [Rhizopus microsporus]KAG1230954.1 hypothetical protein G6F67_006098 [Rhizopus microsporus]KAG1263298.1 hypothetical protein G6F68_005255 [Rhizopus microsporus]